jgi:proteasome lid subunit RPN8/RPN11
MKREHCWVLLGSVRENLWFGRRAKMTRGAPCSVDFNADYVINREETKGDVIGWLHTHPGMIASPSNRDHRTMKAWVLALGHPLVCAIAGVDGLRAYWYMDDESEPIESAVCVKLANFIVGVTNPVCCDNFDQLINKCVSWDEAEEKLGLK